MKPFLPRLRRLRVETLEQRRLLSVVGNSDIVLIDSGLPDAEFLAQAVEKDAMLLFYDSEHSPSEVLAQVEALADLQDGTIASLSILSHGIAGQFHLGNEPVSADMSPEQVSAWQTLSTRLADGANIYVYGCNVADGLGAGQALLDSLADLTGGDVFASNDLTGEGGDWDLEAASAGDEAELAAGPLIPLDADVLKDYSATLDGEVAILDPWVSWDDGGGPFSYTVSAGSNRALVFVVSAEHSSSIGNIDGVTWGGQALTWIDTAVATAGWENHLEVWYLDEAGITAATGSTFVITGWSGGADPSDELYAAVSLENVDQTVPVGEHSPGSAMAASSVQPSSALNKRAGDLVLYATASGEQGQTQTSPEYYIEGVEIDSGGVGQVLSQATRKIVITGGTEQPAAQWSGGSNNRLVIIGAVFQHTNLPPEADGNGPYTIDEGQPVTLDAYASWDPEGDMVFVSETFMNDTAPDWTRYGGAILTSGGADPSGEGWLRLTNDTGNQSGAAIYNTAIDSGDRVRVTFDFTTYSNTGGSADGITFFLLDGSETSPAPGAYGGSLGYAQRDDPLPGVTQGYLGVGLDEYGNFANPTEGRQGGPGRIPNTVTVRGSGDGAATTPDNYQWIATSPDLGTFFGGQNLAVVSGTRPDQMGADYRRAIVMITPNGVGDLNIRVELQFGYDTDPVQVISETVTIGGFQDPVPATFKFGFTASTGGETNYHEIRNFEITTISASTDLTYEWDLDNDGFYDDATGVDPTIPWATLVALGLPSDGTPQTIGLRVTDLDLATDTAATTLTINNLPPTADPNGPYTIDEGQAMPLVLDGSGSSDPVDPLTYAWDLDDDGFYDDAVGSGPTIPWGTLGTLGLASDGTPLTIGLQVDDGDGGTGTATTTLTINNLPPTTADNTVTTGQDIPYTFTAADFNFADPNSYDSLEQVQITTLESVGSLELSGVPVNLNDVIDVADINAGNLEFVPVPGTNGTGYDSFQFRVRDDTEYSAAVSTLDLINATYDADPDGFAYADDAFGTSLPAFADGTYEAAGGYSGGGLRVYLGPGDTTGATSGGWSDTFNLASNATITVSLRYRMLMGEGYEANEYGEVILDIDGTRYGADTNNSLVHVVGDGNGGGTDDTGWLYDQLNIPLGAGNHTLTIGAYNNDATYGDEWVEVFFDDVTVTETTFNIMTIDVNPVQVVWHDVDGDGIQDAGEPGIKGAAVELFSSGGVSLGVTITDDNGSYFFGGLTEGADYYLQFRVPVGDPAYAFTIKDAGGDDAIDSDADDTGVTEVFTLVGNNLGCDAGLVNGPAPGFGFSLRAGGEDYEEAWGVATDADGNAYVVGSFEGTADFDHGPGTYTLTSTAGSVDAFVAKYSSTGALVWARRMGGTDWDDGYGIALNYDGGNVASENFEMGSLGGDWTTYSSDPGGRLRVTGAYGTAAGSYALLMDRSNRNPQTLNEAIWTVDMSGVTDPTLSFYHAEWADGQDAFSGDFTGHYNADGVAISDDGVNWHPVWDAANQATRGEWLQYSVDLAAEAAAAGMTLGPNFQIKFQQYGDRPIATGGRSDGRGYDEITITVPPAGDGSVYATGCFRGAAADFGTDVLASNGAEDIFVAKLDPSDGNFIWARRMGGTGWDDGYAVTVAGDGSVYSTGYFKGTADFDPGPGTYNLDSAGAGDVYISRLDKDGNFLGAQQMGGTNWEIGYGIAVNRGGNVHIAGYFTSTADFDPDNTHPGDTDLLTSVSGSIGDVFVAKLDAAGDFLWAQRMGGAGWDYACGIAIADDGSVYTSGYFYDTADFGATNLISDGDADIFACKLDAAGDFQWAKRMGGTGYDAGFGMAVAGDGTIYTTGYFSDTVDFDPGPGTQNLDSAGLGDVFLSQLDSNGDFVSVGQMGGAGDDCGYGIAPADNGCIYAVGSFSGTADFNPGAGTFNLTSVDNSIDIFLSDPPWKEDDPPPETADGSDNAGGNDAPGNREAPLFESADTAVTGSTAGPDASAVEGRGYGADYQTYYFERLGADKRGNDQSALFDFDHLPSLEAASNRSSNAPLDLLYETLASDQVGDTAGGDAEEAVPLGLVLQTVGNWQDV